MMNWWFTLLPTCSVWVHIHCVPKNCSLCRCLYLHQILTDIQTSFTGSSTCNVWSRVGYLFLFYALQKMAHLITWLCWLCWLSTHYILLCVHGPIQQAARVKTEAQTSGTGQTSRRGAAPGPRKRMPPEEINIENSITDLLMQQKRSRPGRHRGQFPRLTFTVTVVRKATKCRGIWQRIDWNSGKC